MHCCPYKISHVQELFPSDLPARETCSKKFLLTWKWTKNGRRKFCGQTKPISIWHANTQNGRIWATENPLETQPVPLHNAKVTVWYGFTVSFIIRSYFFKETNALGPVTVTVSDQRYECLLRNHAILALQRSGCVDWIFFMQDGATPHIAKPVKQLLKRHFGNSRIINRHFTTVWPFRLPDLIPCDF